MSTFTALATLVMGLAALLGRPAAAEDVLARHILVKDAADPAQKRLSYVGRDPAIGVGDGYTDAPNSGTSLHLFSLSTGNAVCAAVDNLRCRSSGGVGDKVVCRSSDGAARVGVKPGVVKAKAKSFAGFELDARVDQLPVAAILRVGAATYCSVCGADDDVRRDGSDGVRVKVRSCEAAPCPAEPSSCDLPPPPAPPHPAPPRRVARRPRARRHRAPAPRRRDRAPS